MTEDISGPAVGQTVDRQRRFYESLIAATPDLVYAFDRDGRFIFANAALLRMWGRTLEESIGKRLIEVGYEPWHAEMHEREIAQVIATRAAIRGEVGFPHATLGWRIYDYIFTPVLDEAGEVESIAGTTRDITDLKRAEEHLQLLVNELNHRVKNTLATVQSFAVQTFRGDAADPRARAAFEARLVALSNAHTVLTQANWESACLSAIAAQALAPFAGDAAQPRITAQGEDIQLLPQIALALAMALHELASNAVKYGALSNETGHVVLDWKRQGADLQIVWREAGGPAVAAPGRKGFGSRLLERGLAHELNGRVELAYHPTGVVCTIAVPNLPDAADA
jgi:PAS domain S-box-containing protein